MKALMCGLLITIPWYSAEWAFARPSSDCNPRPPEGRICSTNTYDPRRAIEAFADPIAINLGDELRLKVHVPDSSEPKFDVTIFRFGRRGTEAVLLADHVASKKTLSRCLQRGNSCATGIYVGPQCTDSPRPYESGAQWCDSFRHTIAPNFGSGIYAVEVSAAGSTFVAPFIVRGEKAPLAVLASTNTWQAYNPWGGGSYYHQTASCYSGDFPKGLSISQVRPNLSTNNPEGDCHLANADALITNWLTDRGYKFEVLTDTDLDTAREPLRGVGTLILGSHPEYWSNRMYERLESFIAGGGSVIYLGGNGLEKVVDMTGTQMTYIDKRTRIGTSCPGRLLGIQYYDYHSTEPAFPPSPSAQCDVVRTASEIGTLCLVYTKYNKYHWAFEGTSKPWIGVGNNNPTFCGGNIARHLLTAGASGHEVDRTDSNCQPDPSKWKLEVIADAYDRCGQDRAQITMGQITFYATGERSGVFSVGSTAFSGGLSADPELATMLCNVLNRFGHSPRSQGCAR